MAVNESNTSQASQDRQAAAEPPRRILRIIAAVLAGVIVSAVAAIATDMLMVAIGMLPPLGERAPDVALAFARRIELSTRSQAYVAARLAPNQPMRHTMILGARICGGDSRRNRNVERPPGVRAQMVLAGSGGALTSQRVGWRLHQDSQQSVAVRVTLDYIRPQLLGAGICDCQRGPTV